MHTQLRSSLFAPSQRLNLTRRTAELRWPLVLMAGVLVTVLSGCAATQPAPTTVVVTFEAAAGLNPDQTAQPLPLEVKLFELSSLGALDGADFFSIYDDAQSVLGVDLHGSESLRIQPGEIRTLKRELKPDSKYIALVAAYRDIENAQWRASIEVESNTNTALLATLAPLAVSIVVAEE